MRSSSPVLRVDPERPRDVADGERPITDVAVGILVDPAGRFLARQVGISGFKTVLRFHQAELYLALNKEVPDAVVAKLQNALDELRAEGVVEKIRAKYL